MTKTQPDRKNMAKTQPDRIAIKRQLEYGQNTARSYCDQATAKACWAVWTDD